MAEFFFNFKLSDEEKEFKELENTKDDKVEFKTEYTPVLQSAMEHQPDINKPLYQYLIHNHQKLDTRTIPKLQCNIHYIRLDELKTDHPIAEDDLCQLIKFTETENSDLVPGIYEGGLKVWECTFDLIQHLINVQVDFEECRVLDLGCGVGLLGIYALINGAKEIHFQDYNREVISCVTIPNVLLNILKRERNAEDDATNTVDILSTDHFQQLKRCKFFSGDWSNFATLLAEKHYKYDIILTSETIYCVESQHKLLNVFQRFLKPQGEVFVAAKTHYFGVGGNIAFFCDVVSKTNLFDYKVAQEYNSNVPRQIIKLTLK